MSGSASIAHQHRGSTPARAWHPRAHVFGESAHHGMLSVSAGQLVDIRPHQLCSGGERWPRSASALVSGTQTVYRWRCLWRTLPGLHPEARWLESIGVFATLPSTGCRVGATATCATIQRRGIPSEPSLVLISRLGSPIQRVAAW